MRWGWKLAAGALLSCVGLALMSPAAQAGTPRRGCHAIVGAGLLAIDHQYVVSVDQSTGEMYACRRATGAVQTLAGAGGQENTFAHVVIRGAWLAAAIDASDDQGMSYGNEEDIYLYHLGTRYPQRADIDPCADAYGGAGYVQSDSSDGCYPTSLQVNLRGDVSWTLDYRFSDISWSPADLQCLSAQLCVASDSEGGVLSTAAPSAGVVGWHRTQAGTFTFGGVSDLTCPSADGCFGFVRGRLSPLVGLGSDAVQVQAVAAEDPLAHGTLTCPSSTLCLDANGPVLAGSADTGADLSADHSGFSQVLSFGVSGQAEATCADAGLCVAWDSTGQQPGDGAAPSTPVEIAASTAPASAGSWRQATLQVPGAGPTSITCPSDDLCVGFNPDGYLYTSTDPAADQWSGALLTGPTGAPAPGLSDLSCPSAELCVATDDAGDVYTSTDPAGGPSTWESQALDPASAHSYPPGTESIRFDFNVTCASPALCVLTGVADGQLYTSQFQPPVLEETTDLWTSTAPGSGQWSEQVLPNLAASDLQCAAGGACLAFDDAGDLLTNGDPTDPASGWQSQRFDGPACSLAGLICEVDQLWVHDGRRTRLAGQSPAQAAAHQIAHVVLSSDPDRLSWTLNGRPRTLALP